MRIKLTRALSGALLLWVAVAWSHSSSGAEIDVAVRGIDGALFDNVSAGLELLLSEQNPSLDSLEAQEITDRVRERIRQALQPYGYYRPTIEGGLTPSASDNDRLRLTFDVAAGDPILIQSIAIDIQGPGVDDEQIETILGALPFTQGDALDHGLYEQSKQQLVESTHRLGYIDAQLATHKVAVDLLRYEASIELSMQTGPKYLFGDVTYDQRLFSQEYLKRYRVIEPGKPFVRDALAEQRAVLSASGQFSDVVVEAGEPTLDDQPSIPVRIGLTPMKANRYRGRVGWGTETGAGVQFDWTRRRFGPDGHRFHVGGTAVQERQRLAIGVRYEVPLNPLAGERLEFGIRHESKDLDYTDVELTEGGNTRISTSLAEAHWQLPPTTLGNFHLDLSAGVNYATESYDVFEVVFGNLDQDLQQAIADGIGPSAVATLAPDFRAVIPEIKIGLQQADQPLHINSGHFFGLRLLGATEQMGSNISFLQARLAHWSIFPIGDRNRLLLRTALGFTDAESREVFGVTFNQIPEFYEFRGGGARNIRGYGFETLFPRDGVTGGKHQLIGSVEYEHEVFEDFSAALFVDGGNVFNEWDKFEEKFGAGVGVRWRSPFGPARFDIAFPLNESKEGVQIYFSVGPEF